MARDQYTGELTTDDWEQVNSGAVTGSFSLQIIRGDVMVRFTTNTTQPTEENGMMLWEGWTGLETQISAYTQTASMQHIWLKRIAGQPTTYYIDHG
jgi:hypothetical protein